MEDTNRKVKTFTFHDSVNESMEWYTPRPLIEKLGIDFDLDPASSVAANSLIQAKNIFTKEINGLEQDWFGNVWLNPPYGKDVPVWLEKAIYESRTNNVQVIALVFSRTDTIWFHKFATKFDQICFMKGRLAFVKAETMEKGSTSGAGSMLLSIGEDMNTAVRDAELGFIAQANTVGRGYIE
tara:strand:+ start:538 stop:1083 length:546 start_codon:yes stop_codon:yes gene_type:complete